MKRACVSLFVSLAVAVPLWADVTLPEALGEKADASGRLTADVELTQCGAVTLTQNIDLAGHNLTLKGVSSVTWGEADDATFMDSRESGTASTLWIENTGDVTQAFGLAGRLRFVKDGVGTWVSPKGATFSGGLEIRAGVFTAAKYGKMYDPFGNPPSIVVRSGATLNLNACYGFETTHSVVLDGGTLLQGRNNNYSDRPFQAALSLSDDSFFGPDACAISIRSPIQLNGHTLRLSSTADCWWTPASIDNGTIDMANGSWTLLGDIGLLTSGRPTANLSVGDGVQLAGDFTYSVLNLSVASSASVSCSINVYGAYKPSSSEDYFPRLMDGSSLDLSGLTAAAKMKVGNFAMGTSSATTRIGVSLGSRTLAANEKIVEWTASPENVSFTFTGENVESGKFVISASGIVYDPISDIVDRATWTGRGERANWKDPANWTCYNSLGDVVAGTVPTESMTITMTGDVSSVTLDAKFPFAGLRLDSAFLSQSTSWRGFDLNRLADESSLDLRGQSLEVSISTSGESPNEITVTDTSSTANTPKTQGTLNFIVENGVTFTNRTVALTGNMKVVKSGPGTFVAAREGQSYLGVTEVAEGILRCGVEDLEAQWGQTPSAGGLSPSVSGGLSPFGWVPTLEVATAGVLDPAGSYNWSNVVIDMRGGVISNTVKRLGTKLASYISKTADYPFDPKLNLFAETRFVSTDAFNFLGVLTSRQHKLTIDCTEAFFLCPKSAEQAVVEMVNGKLKTFLNMPLEAATMTLVMNGATFDFGGDVTVSNYCAETTAYNAIRLKDDWRNVASGSLLNVCGAFKPVSTRFFGCTLQNGATLDLNGQAESWYSAAEGQYGSLSVGFVTNAHITVDVHERTFVRKTKIVEWSEETAASLKGVKFRLDAHSRSTRLALIAKPYVSAADPGGLWVDRRFVILIQ